MDSNINGLFLCCCTNFTFRKYVIYIVKIINIIVLLYLIILNNCTHAPVFNSHLTNCLLILSELIILYNPIRKIPLAPDERFFADVLLTYYSGHCNGQNSKKHERRRNSDPIYRLMDKNNNITIKNRIYPRERSK